ncbi:MAG: hypothetical protein J7M14_05630 [Planctomycetes bacterium]|nr:hypothetical protein [Planctomycetota bacterium]
MDTNVLYVDAANNRVGINKSNPSQALEVYGNVKCGGISSSTIQQYYQYANESAPIGVWCYKREATDYEHAAVVTGCQLGINMWNAWDGSTYGRGAYCIVRATEDWDDSSYGTKYEIWTTPNGSTTNSLALTVEADGDVTFAKGLGIGSMAESAAGNSTLFV